MCFATSSGKVTGPHVSNFYCITLSRLDIYLNLINGLVQVLTIGEKGKKNVAAL
jgi:hypothetical protein